MNGLQKIGVAVVVPSAASMFIGFGWTANPDAAGYCAFYGFLFLMAGLLMFAIGRMLGDGPAIKAQLRADAKQAELRAISSRVKSIG
jgi:hypothetical protein